MSDNGVPSLLDRHWAESALAIGAVVIAAVSLWVAYDTERTNRELVDSERQLVAASSWPFVQVAENDAAPNGGPGISLIMYNGGIGPAKVETFELFWKGEPQRNPNQLLRNCCVQTPSPPGVDPLANVDVGVSSSSGIIVRPGQIMNFIFLSKNAQDAAIVERLRAGLNNLAMRYCYCSAFDECWLQTDVFGKPRNLHPPQVESCPRPAVRYTNQG